MMYVEVEFDSGIIMKIPESVININASVLSLISKDIGLGQRFNLMLTEREYEDNPIGLNMSAIDIKDMIIVSIELGEVTRK